MTVTPYRIYWVCKCGHNFGEGRHDRFMTFGFNKLCPACGEDVGLHGSINQVDRKTSRWVRKIDFKFFDPKTWHSEWKEEFKI